MQLLTYFNISTGKLSLTETGSTITLPQFVQGDSVVMGLRLTEQVDGASFETQRVVTNIKASLGFIDQRPTSGFFVIRKGVGPYVEGTNQTTKIAHSALPSELQSALVGIGIANASVSVVDGSWIIENAGAEGVSLGLTGASAAGALAELLPLSFVRVRELLRSGKYQYEIRLIQSPIASTVIFDNIVPPSPYVQEVQEGGTEATTVWPEIQSLTLPPAFRGTYQLVRGFKKSGELSLDDGPDEIKAALDLIADEGGSFKVTNPKTNVAHITFEGTMAGIPQDEIVVQVFSAPDGDTTFTLDLNTAEVAAAVRKSETIKPFLEIEISYQDVNDPTTIHKTSTPRVPVTLTKDLNWDGLETAANIDWLKPPHGESYVPFTPSQIITGTQNYTATFGDGSLFTFVISHNLATLSLLPPSIRNNSTGAHLIHGTDYRITAATTNTITIQTLAAGAWGVNALKIVVGAAGPRAAFQAHTHTIAQIEGLSLILDDLGSRVETLESLLPATSPSTPAGQTSGPVASWQLPELFQIFPTRTPVDEKTVKEIDASKLPRNGGLLPAIYTKAVPLVSNALPVTPIIGIVYHFTAAGELIVPGFLGRKSLKLLTGGYYAWDGRGFYGVTRYNGTEPIAESVTATAVGTIGTAGNSTVTVSGTNMTTTVLSVAVASTDTDVIWSGKVRTAIAANAYLSARFAITGGTAITLTEKITNTSPRLSNVNLALANGTCTGITNAPTSVRNSASVVGTGDDVYYPSDFDHELFRIHVGEKQLRLGKTFSVDFSLVAAVFNSNVAVQWGVAIDIGIPTAEGTIARNLLAVTFLPPSLDHTFILTEVPSSHCFGLRVIRKMVEGVDTLLVNRVLYNESEIASTVITSKNFVVRARLVRFDTANNLPDPRGLVAFEGLASVIEDSGSENTFGVAVIN